MVPTSFWRSCRALLPRAAIAALGSALAHATVKYVFNGTPYTYIYPTTGCLTKKMRLTMTPSEPLKASQQVFWSRSAVGRA